MALFSERYNYVKVSDVIIRETITPEIQNAICSCYDRLQRIFIDSGYYYDTPYNDMERYLWTYFLNQREGNFYDGRKKRVVATSFIEDAENPWYRKMDLLEFTIKYLHEYDTQNNKRYSAFNTFTQLLNYNFERLNFAYRVVNTEIIEITAKEELDTIESATHDSPSNVKMHLNEAIKLYAQRPVGNYRNSIKESISAVEAYCREITGEKTLGNALNNLQSKGIIIPNILKVAFDKLYAYTNQPDTGIRHALMDDEGGYIPASEEALFMLVSCSAFINYLRKKV